MPLVICVGYPSQMHYGKGSYYENSYGAGFLAACGSASSGIWVQGMMDASHVL